MNLQASVSNAYLIVIPRNYTNDLHVCGRCKVQFNLLTLFLEHKNTCNAKLDFDEIKPDTGTDFQKKMEMDNLIEMADLRTFDETERDSNYLVLLNNWLSKNQSQLKLKPNGEEINVTEIAIHQSDITSGVNTCNLKSTGESNSFAEPKMTEYNRTLQNDEEDIATLLANQLGSEASADEINAEVKMDLPSEEPLDETDHAKENEDKDENKVLYRGKMRKLFPCQVEGCTYKSLLRKDIERHARVHTGERPFKCFLCEKAFTRADKLLLHQRIHAGDKRYKCPKCEYASVDSGSLIKHLRVHNGERPFKCQLCSYRARDSSQLTVHLRTHTGDSPFICTNDKCKAAFKTNSDLKRHMVVHSGEKPHSCLYCPYKCTLKRNLQIHIQSQHPNGELKEYKCVLCPKFISPTIRRLKNHMKKAHGDVEAKEKPEPKENNLGNSDFMKYGGSEETLVEKQSNFEKKKRKSRRNADKIAVGVMNKAYDCKLCEASFVCQDSLLTHERYHIKVEEEIRKSEGRRDQVDEESFEGQTKNVKRISEEEGESQKRIPQFNDSLVLNDGYIVDHSFTDSLRNAEILASLNPIHGSTNVRQYVMIAPQTIQNSFTGEEYVLTPH